MMKSNPVKFDNSSPHSESTLDQPYRHIRPKLRYTNSKPNPLKSNNQENNERGDEDLDLLLNNIRKRMTRNLSVNSNNAKNKNQENSKISPISKAPCDPDPDSTSTLTSTTKLASTRIAKNIKSDPIPPKPIKSILKKNTPKQLKQTDIQQSRLKNRDPIAQTTRHEEITTVSAAKSTLNQTACNQDNNVRSYNDKRMKFNIVERSISNSEQTLPAPTNTTAITNNDKNNKDMQIVDLKGAQIFAASNIEGYHSTLEHENSVKSNAPNTYQPYLNRDLFDSDTDADEDSIIERDVNSIDDDYDDFNDEDFYDSENSLPQLGQEKPFILLWQALSNWITPKTVDFVRLLQQTKTKGCQNQNANINDLLELNFQVDRSDIGASRCAGLMSILKMHMPKCLEEICIQSTYLTNREIDHRLSNLCRTFDYSRPMVKFDFIPLNTQKTKMYWRALCCILLQIVIVEGTSKNESEEEVMTPSGKDETSLKLPISVASLGISIEEYQYLVQSAIPSLGENISLFPEKR